MNFYKALYDVFLLKWSMYFRRTRVLWRPRPSLRPHPLLDLNHYSHPSEIGKMEAMNYCPTSCVFWSFVRVVCRTGITGLHRLYRTATPPGWVVGEIRKKIGQLSMIFCSVNRTIRRLCHVTVATNPLGKVSSRAICSNESACYSLRPKTFRKAMKRQIWFLLPRFAAETQESATGPNCRGGAFDWLSQCVSRPVVDCLIEGGKEVMCAPKRKQ